MASSEPIDSCLQNPHEVVLRSRPGGMVEHWGGCKAGIDVIGLESDGTMKACPSLPTAPYTGGNVRDLNLEEIWAHADALRFARDRSIGELWGFCKTCYYADICRGGCSWTAHATLGRRGNNPFCYHRVTELEKRGIRERLVPVERAPKTPLRLRPLRNRRRAAHALVSAARRLSHGGDEDRMAATPGIAILARSLYERLALELHHDHR